MELNQSFVWGVDHHKANVDVREQLARIDTPELLTALTPNIAQESMLLSTCNRYEIYGSADTHIQQDILGVMSSYSGIEYNHLNEILYFKTGEEMLRHGFAVASSLESMVLGEPQILGQMKQAYTNAKEHGTINTMLDRFCSTAFHVGKQVRSHTSIAAHPVSIASIAVRTAQDIFGDLNDSSVVLIGAGDMGVACAKNLKNTGVKELTIVNRNRLRAVDLASPLGAKTHDFNELTSAIAQADIIISSTASEEPIITPEIVEEAFQTRKQKPVFFIDLALPRDIHPDVQNMNNCFVYDIDQLGGIAKNGQKCRASQIEKAQLIIDSEVEAFIYWSNSQKNSHIINKLRNNFESVRAEVLNKYPSHEAEEATRLLLNKLLHKPTCIIKNGEHSSDDLTQLLETFFESNCTRHK